MKLAIGSDHAGFDLKEELRVVLHEWKHDTRDLGCSSKEPCDYPNVARDVARAVAARQVDAGVLICSTGIGVSIAANRMPGIRAALCANCDMAYRARIHNDANILCLGARYTTLLDARAILQVFLRSSFSGEERHCRRVAGLDAPVEKCA